MKGSPGREFDIADPHLLFEFTIRRRAIRLTALHHAPTTGL